MFRFFVILLFVSTLAHAGEDSIILQSTTSTKNSGLYDYILPIFKNDSGITVHVVAVGTGAAIRNAKNCDADVLLTHSPKREKKFVRDGFATKRYQIMHNDFVIIGPLHDPAQIHQAQNVIAALERIAETKSLFTSRGDDSGTHSKEQALWKQTNINPQRYSGTWYRELGAGMGTTINATIGMQAYTLTDRATWIKFNNKANFTILIEGDAQLFNTYGAMLINPLKCPNVKTIAAQIFVNWLISPKGQAVIASYRVNGTPLFFTNAK